MAAAVKANTYGNSNRRVKKADRSVRNQLRAAKRAGASAIYVPTLDVELASAVAQLAASSGVPVQTTDELSSIRGVGKVTDVVSQEAEEVDEGGAAKPAQPKLDKPKPLNVKKVKKEKATDDKVVVVEKKVDTKKAERREAQAAARAAAEDKRRAKREEAKRLKAERLEKQATKKPAKVSKPKAQKKVKPTVPVFGPEPVVVVATERSERIAQLRTKYNKVQQQELTAQDLAAKAAYCEFDFSVYLQRLLMTHNKDGKPVNGAQLATAYLNTVTSFSKSLGQALISPYIDEIRDALQAGWPPAETFHSDEELVPHVKQKHEDPRSNFSDSWAIHHEGGMHLYQFTERVHVTVTEDDGKVIESGMYNRKVMQDRTKAYISWLEANTPIPHGYVELNAYDKRTGEVVNDFHLEPVIDTIPVMVGNLQVGMEYRQSEQYVPRSWEVTKFRHELRNKGSANSRKNRGNDPVAGIVGLSYLEGLEAVDSTPAAANDDEVVPWDDTTADEVAFTPLPNPKLGDAKIQVPIIKPGMYKRLHPEYIDNLSLRPHKRAAKWVEHSSEQIQQLFLASMTEPDREVGLFSDPDYRWDPGPPSASNVLPGHSSWFENQTKVLGSAFVGPPKPALVLPVTRKKEELRQLFKENCPVQPNGYRKLRWIRAKISELTDTTRTGWFKRWAAECRDQAEEARLDAWLRERHVVNFVHDNERYVSWLREASMRDTLYPDTLQEHLGNMEAVAPSVKPVYHDCQVCRASAARARAEEALALRAKRRQAKNPYGLPTIAAKLDAAERLKHKATKESAGSGPAKIGEPVIRVSSPVKSTQDSSGDGQVEGYNLQNFTPAERSVFISTIKGQVIEPSLWNKLKRLIPSEELESAISNWVNRGTLIVPPAYG